MNAAAISPRSSSPHHVRFYERSRPGADLVGHLACAWPYWSVMSYADGLSPTEAAMSRRKKEPLRELTAEERQELSRFARSHATPAAEVIRARILLAVARGDDYQAAARTAGRRSGDAASHLVARFNAEGMAALAPRHGGGRRPTYGPEAKARIAAEAARVPTPEADGTAT